MNIIKGNQKMNNKGEFLARNLIIILILFGLVCGLGYLVIADMASETNYNVSAMVDEDFQGRYDTLSNVTTDIYDMQNATQSEEGMSVISTYTTMFKSTFSVISIIFGSFNLVRTTMSNFAQDFGVPSVIANLIFPAILVIFITLIVFVIISSISRGRM